MLYSALNFAAGFFGIPYEDKYLQSITIEDPGVRPPLPFSFLPPLPSPLYTLSSLKIIVQQHPRTVQNLHQHRRQI